MRVRLLLSPLLGTALAALTLLAAVPVGADPLGLVAYDALLSDPREIVFDVPLGEGRRVELRDGVQILLNQQGEIVTAVDRDSTMPLGCLTISLVELQMGSEFFENYLSHDATQHLGRWIDDLVVAYARRVRPGFATPAAVRAQFDVLVEEQMTYLQNDREAGGQWPPTDLLEWMDDFLDPNVRADRDQFISDVLAAETLPVLSPCF